jgi:hypothetical protein
MARKSVASVVQLPLLLRTNDKDQWFLDIDVNGNLLFQCVGASGQRETKKTLTKTGAWI